MNRRSSGIKNSKKRKSVRQKKADERLAADEKLTEQELATKRLENKCVYDHEVGGVEW